jgi:hypothetical protein
MQTPRLTSMNGTKPKVKEIIIIAVACLAISLYVTPWQHMFKGADAKNDDSKHCSYQGNCDKHKDPKPAKLKEDTKKEDDNRGKKEHSDDNNNNEKTVHDITKNLRI